LVFLYVIIPSYLVIELLAYFHYYVRKYRTAVPDAIMNTISVNKFRDNLKSFIEQVFSEHEPLKVTRRNGEDFVVLSADDWEREQETLYILQNNDLMKQIATSGYT